MNNISSIFIYLSRSDNASGTTGSNNRQVPKGHKPVHLLAFCWPVEGLRLC